MNALGQTMGTKKCALPQTRWQQRRVPQTIHLLVNKLKLYTVAVYTQQAESVTKVIVTCGDMAVLPPTPFSRLGVRLLVCGFYTVSLKIVHHQRPIHSYFD